MLKESVSGLPFVRLVELGKSTSEGKIVDTDFLMSIYTKSNEGDSEFFDFPSKKEIENSFEGQHWYVIENENNKVVGVISAMFEENKIKDWIGKFPLRYVIWRLSVSSTKGWIGRAFILEKYRGKKFLQASTLAIEKIAKEKGCKRIYSIIFRKHQASKKAIEKAGLKQNVTATIRFLLTSLIYYPKQTFTGNWYQFFQKKI